MTTARDKIEDIIEEFVSGVYDEAVGQREAADAILAALPSMIAPLVWEPRKDGQGLKATTSTTHYELHDKGSPSWDFASKTKYVTFCGETVAQRKAAANEHHIATIMSAFETPATSLD